MNIYTRKGDKGQTSLYGGTKINKDDLRVSCYGTTDEANSILGVIYSTLKYSDLKNIVRDIQRKMFVVGAQLASDEKGHDMLKIKITQDDINYLENIIDSYVDEFGSAEGFSIPGETVVSSLFHVARTVVRRSERLVVSLSKEEFVCPIVLKYLNRLSDVLFVLAKKEVYKDFVSKVIEKINKIEKSNNLQEEWFEILSNTAYLESQKIGVPVCFSIADESGILLYFKRFKGCILASVTISQNKAYTSSILKMPTKDLMELASPGGSLYGINISDPKIIVFGGGYPLIKNGKQIGSIGISGGTVEEDERIAEKVLEVFEIL